MKQGSLSPEEHDALVSALQVAGAKKSLIHKKKSTAERRVREDSAQTSSIEKFITSLESMGVRVYGVDEPNMSSTSKDI
ncbi:hypothetical protein RchiOBHm_Chr5g0002061 [Rosa chinensis]|uniref:Uncharacterized protein n=1 Tax=Rosa chinensis TaxID=74649 RepID=A0A2P6Q2G0_ROSCH|nr:hypothetical protein RchiOBHm_Chr5g0002061 [Rosa chinensis]